jgi:hypothetical protein
VAPPAPPVVAIALPINIDPPNTAAVMLSPVDPKAAPQIVEAGSGSTSINASVTSTATSIPMAVNLPVSGSLNFVPVTIATPMTTTPVVRPVPVNLAAAPEAGGRGSESVRSAADNTPTLVLNRPVADVSMTPGQVMTISLPRDTFSSTSGGPVTFKAGLVSDNGSHEVVPLPSWVRFDPVSGTFSGEPPVNAPETMHIQVTARDSKGNEAVVIFTIHKANAEKNGGKPGAVKPLSSFRGEGAWLALESGAFTEELVQIDSQTAAHKALIKGRVDVVGRASLSEQIRLAHRHPATGEKSAMARRAT